jgi:hypothetical protein
MAWLALSDAQNVRDPFELLADLRGKRRRRRADTSADGVIYR